MADSIAILAGMASDISDITLAIATVTRSEAAIRVRQWVLLAKRYGMSIAFLVTFLSNDTAIRYERVERDVLNGSAEDALAFKQAITDECNMTAIAVSVSGDLSSLKYKLSMYKVSGAVLLLKDILNFLQGVIIAQVAITSLSLPNLSSTHWVARAFFLLAIISGCLSVYYACSLQRKVGTLFQPESIKNWLRMPPSSDTKKYEPSGASLSAILILSSPFNMMKVSIFALLVGLGIYQGFTWTRALDTSAGKGDSRSVFITFLVATGVCFGFFLLTSATKRAEALLRARRTKYQGYDLNDVLREDHTATQESPGPVNDPEPPYPPENSSVHSRHSSDKAVAGGLAAALDAASRAHLQCATANRQVALEYARISGTI